MTQLEIYELAWMGTNQMIDIWEERYKTAGEEYKEKIRVKIYEYYQKSKELQDLIDKASKGESK